MIARDHCIRDRRHGGSRVILHHDGRTGVIDRQPSDGIGRTAQLEAFRTAAAAIDLDDDCR
ncbi:MAG TPA: hypothetical protein VIC60_13845, partial [Thermomicrobiales bacterium]